MAAQPHCAAYVCALAHVTAAWHSGAWTPLMCAAATGHTDVVALIMQLGAAVNAQNIFG